MRSAGRDAQKARAPHSSTMAWTLRATPSRCGFYPLAVRRFAPTIKRIHLTKSVHDPFGLMPRFAGDPQRVRQRTNIMENPMNSADRQYMKLALEEAKRQANRYGRGENKERPDPLVGCVVVTRDGRVETGYRGEMHTGDHAEFTVLELTL